MIDMTLPQMVQRSFFKSDSEFSKHRISYGGAVKGKRKVFRPLDRKRPLHIVLKSSHAKGRLSLLSQKLKVAKLVEEKAKIYQVKIHGFQNMGNHLHLMVSFKDKRLIQSFLRVVSGLIARLVTGAKKGKAFGKRFWDHLVFTRIITGRRDYSKMHHYLAKNELERDSGHGLRLAVGFHEGLQREARRRKVSLAQVEEEWLKKIDGGAGEIVRLKAEDA